MQRANNGAGWFNPSTDLLWHTGWDHANSKYSANEAGLTAVEENVVKYDSNKQNDYMLLATMEDDVKKK